MIPCLTACSILSLQGKMTVRSEVIATSTVSRVTGCWSGPAGCLLVAVQAGRRKTWSSPLLAMSPSCVETAWLAAGLRIANPGVAERGWMGGLSSPGLSSRASSCLLGNAPFGLERRAAQPPPASRRRASDEAALKNAGLDFSPSEMNERGRDAARGPASEEETRRIFKAKDWLLSIAERQLGAGVLLAHLCFYLRCRHTS